MKAMSGKLVKTSIGCVGVSKESRKDLGKSSRVLNSSVMFGALIDRSKNGQRRLSV